MKRPTVGGLPLWARARRDLWMRTEYLDGLQDGGALPLIFSLTGDVETNRNLCAAVDGLLFTGGQDVSPALFGQEKAPCCEEISPLRDGHRASPAGAERRISLPPVRYPDTRSHPGLH